MNDKDILLNILEAIDYTDDKEAFIKEFIELTQIQAVNDLVNALPPEQKEAVKAELAANKDNPQKASDVLKSRFTDEQMQEALEKSSGYAMLEWMNAINPTLSDEQRQKLINLSKELLPPMQPTDPV